MPLLRKAPGGPYALPVAMAAVKAGERVLLVGSSDPKMLAAVAARSGLTGRVVAVVGTEADGARMSAAAAGAGLLLEVAVLLAWSDIPRAEAGFDVAVIDGTRGWFGALAAPDRRECLAGVFAALRQGGRALVVERQPSAMRSLVQPGRPPWPDYVAAGGAAGELTAAGFRPVRVLAERARWRFVEGLRGN